MIRDVRDCLGVSFNWLITSDEADRLGRVYVLLQQVTSRIPAPLPLIPKCLNVSSKRIESVCEASRVWMSCGSCAIRVIYVACGSAQFLVLQLARRSILRATTLTEVMTLIVASLKACRYADYHEARVTINSLVTKTLMSSLNSLKVLVGVWECKVRKKTSLI